MRPWIILALAYLAFVAVAAFAKLMAGLVFIGLGVAGAVVLIRSNRRLTAGRGRAKQ